MTPDSWIIIGAGGHGKVVYEILLANAIDASDIFFCDDKLTKGPWGSRVHSLKKIASLPRSKYIVAIGDGPLRWKIHNQVLQTHHMPGVAIHPMSCVSRSSKICDGTVICAQANVGPDSVISDCVIINTAANVDHDCLVGCASHIAPHANLCGGVTVGQFCLIGAGTSVKPGIEIGNLAVVGCGATVVKNIKDGTLSVGVPARAVARK